MQNQDIDTNHSATKLIDHQISTYDDCIGNNIATLSNLCTAIDRKGLLSKGLDILNRTVTSDSNHHACVCVCVSKLVNDE